MAFEGCDCFAKRGKTSRACLGDSSTRARAKATAKLSRSFLRSAKFSLQKSAILRNASKIILAIVTYEKQAVQRCEINPATDFAALSCFAISESGASPPPFYCKSVCGESRKG